MLRAALVRRAPLGVVLTLTGVLFFSALQVTGCTKEGDTIIQGGGGGGGGGGSSASGLVAPTNLVAIRRSPGNQVDLSWTGNDPSAGGYYVEKRTGTSGPFTQSFFTGAPNLTSITDPFAVVGEVYQYRIVAFRGQALSAPSNLVTVVGGNASFVDRGAVGATNGFTTIDGGDLDGDGDLDLFLGSSDASFDNRVALNDGTGAFTDSGQLLSPAYVASAAIGDLDGDGDLDILDVSNYVLAHIQLNDGAGGFTFTNAFMMQASYYQAREVILGDVDGDGDLDALVTGPYEGVGADLWLNDGAGDFSFSQTLANYKAGASFGDLDGDGDLDLTLGAYYSQGTPPYADGLRVLLNDGAGTFTDTGQQLGTNEYQMRTLLVDLDGDGDLDLVVADSDVGESQVFFNDGAAAFTPGPTFAVQGLSVAAADFDGDGDADLVFGPRTFGTIPTFLNNGAGVFSAGPDVSPYAYAVRDLVVGDFDGDGTLDVVAVNGDAGSFEHTLFTNDGP
jgi:hypothetical protein